MPRRPTWPPTRSWRNCPAASTWSPPTATRPPRTSSGPATPSAWTRSDRPRAAAPYNPAMTALPAALDAELSALLGAEGWRTDEAARAAHGGDDSRRHALPDGVALPRDRAQVAAIVRACRAHHVPVV